MPSRAQQEMSRTEQLFGLLLFIFACGTVSAFGAVITATSVGDWYQALQKLPFNPPNSVFAPVWTVLYLMIAVAGWLVWRHAGLRGARTALLLYAVQLALNLAWSWLFFGLRAPGAALVGIALLLLASIATAVLFWRVDRLAGLMFVPYCAWLVFAAVLNAAIWQLN